MNELIIKKGVRRTKVLLYDDIEQMPVDRFNKINKYWMLDDAIGSSIEDFDKLHFSRFAVLLDDNDKLLKELQNFRIMIYNIMNEVNVNHLSFACMVHSVNGEEFTDLSTESLNKMLKRLSDLGLTQEDLKKKPQKQKKPSLANWKHIFQKSSGV